jgi:hypothetical protein
VAIGSSNGALVHLWAALGIPWLPQTMLIPVRRSGVPPDEPRQELEWGRGPARWLLDANPGLQLHHMHDPNQDRLMLRTMAYYRLKFRRLPATYRDLLEGTLAPGGTVYLVECGRSWPVTRVGERHVFRFGAVGGATVEEYFRGGPRVRAYFARYGRDRERWRPPEPDGEAPEAEWGFDPALREDVEDLARRRGWRVVRLRFREPEAMSLVAAELHEAWYRGLGTEPDRLLVESFVLMAPLTALERRLVPLRLVFNTEPSADTLRRYLDDRPAFRDVGLMLFSHGTDSIGLTPIAEWRSLLARAGGRGRFLGVDEERYPRDFATFARFHRDVARLRPERAGPPALGLDLFERLLREAAPRHGVEIVGEAPA